MELYLSVGPGTSVASGPRKSPWRSPVSASADPVDANRKANGKVFSDISVPFLGWKMGGGMKMGSFSLMRWIYRYEWMGIYDVWTFMRWCRDALDFCPPLKRFPQTWQQKPMEVVLHTMIPQCQLPDVKFKAQPDEDFQNAIHSSCWLFSLYDDSSSLLTCSTVLFRQGDPGSEMMVACWKIAGPAYSWSCLAFCGVQWSSPWNSS